MERLSDTSNRGRFKEYPQSSVENAWVVAPMFRIMGGFMASLKQFPPIPTGTSDPYVP